MASVLGSEWWTDSANAAVSQAITIPAGTELVLFVATGFAGDRNTNPTDSAITQLNFDNSASVTFTEVGHAYFSNGSSYQAMATEVYRLVSPPTGAQTIYHTLDVGQGIQEGVTYGVIYLDGVDTTTPIGDVTEINILDNAAGPSFHESALTGVGASDLAFLAFYTFGLGDADPTGYGQTAIRETVFNSAGATVGYETGEDVLRVEGPGTDDYLMGVFFVVNDSGAAGTDNLTAADLTGGTPTIDAASLEETVHALTAADITSGTPTIDAATLSEVGTDHVSRFGRAGDSDTTIDLTALGYTGPFSVSEAAASISLSGSTVTISHSAVVHESALISTAGNDVRVWNSTGPANAPQYPYSVSDKAIKDAASQTVLWNGDTGWSLFAGVTEAEATTYLSDRAGKNVNVVMANLIEKAFCYSPPSNAYGNDPFTATLGGGEDDFTAPNEDYWEHVDWILREAHRYGITILAFPAYVGHNHGSEGWAAEIAANGDARMDTYGTWLANRYGSYPNLVWMMGGDSDPVYGGSDITTEVNSLATAIKAVDSAHLMSGHGTRGQSGYSAYPEAWMDFNTAYSQNNDVYPEVRAAYSEVAVMPVFYIEGYYGNEHSMTALGLRTQTWQALAAGAFGHLYGNAPQWYFGEDASHPANSFADTGGLNWQSNLDSFEATLLTHVPTILSGIDLATYTPDHAESVLVSGHDPDANEGVNFAPLSYKATAIVAYMPEAQNVTIATSGLTAGTWDLTWYNPADGTISTEQATVDGSNLVLSPNHAGVDNVLVMELASATDALTAADLVGATPTIDAATVGQAHTLTASDLASGTPTIDAATVGQVHALTAAGIAGTVPTVDAATIGQIHALTGGDLTGAVPTIDAATLSEIDENTDVLTAADLTGPAPTIDAATIGQAHALSAADLYGGTAALDAATIGQRHVFTAQDLTGSAPIIDGALVNAVIATAPVTVTVTARQTTVTVTGR